MRGRAFPFVAIAVLVLTPLSIDYILRARTRKDTLEVYGVSYSKMNLQFWGEAVNDGVVWITSLRCEAPDARGRSAREKLGLSIRTERSGWINVDELDSSLLEDLGFRIPRDGHGEPGEPEWWEYESNPRVEALRCSCSLRDGKVSLFRCTNSTGEPEPESGFQFSMAGQESKKFRLPVRLSELQELFGEPTAVTRERRER